ncbi:MAG: hypothetical protein EON93_16740 [Burkholderiales bacterium]|nr:MAG: hypothetical protein EON93_16740 [Burkholderiales bacterium]
MNIANRIIRLDFDADDRFDDPVLHAINHPIGQVTSALLDWWYRRELEDGQKLPAFLLLVFTELCDTDNASLVHGRVLLAAHSITLYRVDPEWAIEQLLPLFDWKQSEREARGAWEGYLWSPRLYRPMMEHLKGAFLDTATHYAQLGDHHSQYVSLLTLAALEPGDTFKTAELAAAVRTLPAEGLNDLADSLVRAVEGAGDKREEYWRNRLTPFWEKVWPRAKDKAQSVDGEALARLCVAARDEFPAAVSLLQNWLRPVEHPSYPIHRLHEEALCGKFPDAALLLLDRIIDANAAWMPPELRDCLNSIAASAPHLVQSQRYMRIDALARRALL